MATDVTGFSETLSLAVSGKFLEVSEKFLDFSRKFLADLGSFLVLFYAKVSENMSIGQNFASVCADFSSLAKNVGKKDVLRRLRDCARSMIRQPLASAASGGDSFKL